MSGNVFEWCWDWCWHWSESIPAGEQTDYSGLDSGSYRVVRGGSWYNIASNFGPYSESSGIGFFKVKKMAFEIITIPFDPVAKVFHTAELNAFCVNKNILSKNLKFFSQNGLPCWSIFLEYQTVMDRSSPKLESLTETGRKCFEVLREWRQRTAEKEGIPPYVIAKNTQFMDIIAKEITTIDSLKTIRGFGPAKCEHYGKDITNIVKSIYKPNPIQNSEIPGTLFNGESK